MLVSKQQLRVVAAASKDAMRPVLGQVYIRVDGPDVVAVATDSYILAEVRQKALDPAEYPIIPGADEYGAGATELFIPAKEAKKVAAVLSDGSGLQAFGYADGREKALMATDMKNVVIASAANGMNYPKYENVIPESTPVGTMRLDPKLLKALLEVFKDDHQIILEFHADMKPLVIKNTNSEVKKRALIMPQRG